MKGDSMVPDGDDEGRDSLRGILRDWSVPGPPPAIEAGLRAEFRHRRSRRTPAVWLSLAAALGLLALWPFLSSRVEERTPSADVAPKPPPTLPASPAAASPAPGFAAAGPATAKAPRATTSRGAVTRREAAVVVEPGQAELLAELGRRAWERTEAGPGASLPSMPADEAPAYRVDWQDVAGEWPAVQVVVPGTGR